MYSNIGKKIKFVASFLFWLETIVAAIAGLALADYTQYISLALAFLAIIGSFFTYWLLYGFGEIIVKLCEIERNTRSSGQKSEVQKTEVQNNVDHERIGKIEMLRSQGLLTDAEYQQVIAKELSRR